MSGRMTGLPRSDKRAPNSPAFPQTGAKENRNTRAACQEEELRQASSFQVTRAIRVVDPVCLPRCGRGSLRCRCQPYKHWLTRYAATTRG